MIVKRLIVGGSYKRGVDGVFEYTLVAHDNKDGHVLLTRKPKWDGERGAKNFKVKTETFWGRWEEVQD